MRAFGAEKRRLINKFNVIKSFEFESRPHLRHKAYAGEAAARYQISQHSSVFGNKLNQINSDELYFSERKMMPRSKQTAQQTLEI